MTTINTKNFSAQLNSLKNKRDTLQALTVFACTQAEQGTYHYFDKIRIALESTKDRNLSQWSKYVSAIGLTWQSNKNAYKKTKGATLQLPSEVWYDFETEKKQPKGFIVDNYLKNVANKLAKEGYSIDLEQLTKIISKVGN